MVHICTPQSFDGFELPNKSECPYCLKVTKQSAGYIGARCHECNQIFSGEEWRGTFCKHYRILLKLSKRQLGELFGVSKHTIHSYENRKCLDKYFDWIQKQVRLIH